MTAIAVAGQPAIELTHDVNWPALAPNRRQGRLHPTHARIGKPTCFNKHTVEIDWAGRPLTLETGRIARQADGAVLATYGGTTVLATVVAAKEERPGIDFFPLTVNYQEKTFAAGKIPGGYFKREGRPTEKETLTSRLIDRPIRPLFARGLQERDASHRHRARRTTWRTTPISSAWSRPPPR